MSKSVLFAALILCCMVTIFGAPTAEDQKKVIVESASNSAPVKTDLKKKHKETFVEVTYGEEKIVLGNFVNASQIKDVPQVQWKTENDTFYTLALLNLDVPTKKNPIDSDFLLWLVGNIPGNDLGKGDNLVEYVGAFPEKDQGTQNLMFILHEQPQGKIDFDFKFISKT